VSAEEVHMKAQYVTMDDEVDQDTDMDTQIPEASEWPKAERKRIMEKAISTGKKAKAHMKQMKMSLTADDIQLITTKVEHQLSEVWENPKKHRASIFEQIHEVKTALEHLRIKAKQ